MYQAEQVVTFFLRQLLNFARNTRTIRDLGNDYYDFDEKNFTIVGRRNHTKYQLGDPIRIQVARANLERKQLDFTLADD